MKYTISNHPDQLVRFGEAAKIVESITREPVSTASIYRWASRGLRGVRLRTAFAGGHRRTSETFLREFFAAVTAAADGVSVSPSITTTNRRADQIARADQELRDAGI